MKRFSIIPVSILMPAFIVIASLARAQTPVARVISTGGGYFTGSNGSLSITVGETVVQSYSGGTGMLTQGFQQTVLEASTPLPLNFLSFTANLANGRTQLQWVTDSELNTGHFDVERSTDGTAFTKLFTVQHIGSAGTINTYNAVDSFPVTGTDYYRVMEVDLNGVTFYSPIVVVTLNQALTCMVYPNPAISQVFVNIQSNTAMKVAVNWYDIRGQLLLSRQTQLAAGANQFQFNIENFAKGVYIVKIVGLDGLPSFTVIKH